MNMKTEYLISYKNIQYNDSNFVIFIWDKHSSFKIDAQDYNIPCTRTHIINRYLFDIIPRVLMVN